VSSMGSSWSSMMLYSKMDFPSVCVFVRVCVSVCVWGIVCVSICVRGHP
jgi:hypothetical protein